MPKFTNVTVASSIQDLVASIERDVTGSTKYKRFKRLYANDRVAFVYDVMPEYAKTITPYQVEILANFDSGIRRQAIRGPHGLGKTFLASIMVHHSVLTSEEDCKVPTTASAWRQLDKYLWPEIKKASRNIAWPVVGRDPYIDKKEFLTISLKLQGEDIEAFALASDDHTSLEGAHAKRIVYVFDEAKTIPAPTWDAIEGAFSTEGLSDHEVFCLAISTPGDPAGRFYDIHMQKPGYDDWHVRHVTIDEAIRAGRISPEWVERRRLQWGEDSPTFQNRVLGEFADNSEDGIIPLSWVHAANERWLAWDKAGRPEQSGRATMGVDVARMGADATVFALRNGSVLQKLYTFRKLPTTSIAGHIRRLASGRYVHIEMDGGLGASVYDMLKESNDTAPTKVMLKPVIVGGKTNKKDRSGEMTFYDTRTAMYWNLRELLDPDLGEGIALPPHPQLTLDLTAMTWEPTSTGVLKLEAKKDVKRRIGRSTDYGDACALAFWSPSTGGGVVI